MWDEHVEEVTYKIEDLMFRTDDRLSLPGDAFRKVKEAQEKYELLFNRATGVSGIDYAGKGKYGCKIDTSYGSTDDVLVDLLEAEEEYEQAMDDYAKAREDLIALVESAHLNDDEQKVMYLRNMYDDYPSFESISQRCGFKDRYRAWYLYKKGFVKISNVLRGSEDEM